MEEPAWLGELNDGQRRAVDHCGGPLLVIAGAGTGKTRTLAARVARLIADGQRPDRILLLTFTRRAAREMLHRARSLSGEDRARQVWGGTFHSVAVRLLRRFGGAVGLDESFTILDRADTGELLGLIRTERELGETGVRFPSKDTLAAIYSRVANAQRPLSAVLDRAFPWCADHGEEIAEVFRDYAARKRTQNVVDFDDLLLLWRALARHEPARRAIAGLFDHVLVDEYQDVNRLQADLLLDTFGPGAAITVVGDDAQAIYSFRAASVENIESFPDRWDDVEVVTLERNYRSTPQILEAANRVMEAADRRFETRLSAVRHGGPRPQLVTAADEAAQSDAVAQEVLAARERGMRLRDQAVLFRAGHHSDHLELELARRDIPFVKYGGLTFLEAAHVKDLLALLRILDNPRDEVAWHRGLLLLEGVGPATVRDVLARIGVGAEADTATADEPLAVFLEAPPEVTPSAVASLRRLRDALGDCAGRGGSPPPPAAQIERLARLCEDPFRSRYHDAATRLADLERLAVEARSHTTRRSFLADLTLEPPSRSGALAQAPHLDDDWLTLSTIHSAKGCEWRAVHVIHAADGNIPSDMALRDRDGLEEERRLLYVAMTRAKDELSVWVPLRYHHDRFGAGGAHNTAQRSRFLEPAVDAFERIGADRPVGGDERADIEPAAVTVAAELDELWTS